MMNRYILKGSKMEPFGKKLIEGSKMERFARKGLRVGRASPTNSSRTTLSAISRRSSVGSLATVMDRTGAPPETWLLCTQYVCFLMNHTYNKTIGSVPLQALTGTTVDISPLLRFHFGSRYITTERLVLFHLFLGKAKATLLAFLSMLVLL